MVNCGKYYDITENKKQQGPMPRSMTVLGVPLTAKAIILLSWNEVKPWKDRWAWNVITPGCAARITSSTASPVVRWWRPRSRWKKSSRKKKSPQKRRKRPGNAKRKRRACSDGHFHFPGMQSASALASVAVAHLVACLWQVAQASRKSWILNQITLRLKKQTASKICGLFF